MLAHTFWVSWYRLYDFISNLLEPKKEWDVMKYCNKCKKTTSQRYSGRLRICTVCRRKVIIK